MQLTAPSQNRHSVIIPGFRRLLLPSLIAAATLSAPSLAQEQTQNQKPRQSIMEEVLVTAQKREQSMQDVSVAVSAFSGDAIEKMGFEEGLDITQQVPNMSFFAIFGEASSPSVSLRGISLVNFSDSWESPVAIYVDDVYRGNPAGSAIQLFDLNRVEVLRGPQGTLYGRNTTGGLVHYVSKKPTDIFEASASVSYGSYSEVITEGMISGPIQEGIRGRFAIKTANNDGWQTNTVGGETLGSGDGAYVVPDDKLNDTDSLGYRGLLEFDLGNDGTLLLNVHGSEADQNSVGFAHMGYLEPGNTNATCSTDDIQSGLCTSETFGMTGAEAVDGNFNPEHVATGAAGVLSTEIETFGTSATLEWDFDNFQLTSITAVEELEKLLQDDGDGTEVVFFDEQYSADASQFTQEIRLDGTTTKSKWVTGVYYYDDSRDLLTEAPNTETVNDVYGSFFHREYVELDSESWAVFGQYEYDVAPKWTAIIGARYTEEERDFWLQSGPTFYSPFNIRDTFDDDSITGKLGLDWRPSPETLIYGSVSTGFKSGGYSASYNALREASEPVDSEDITNFELGLKTELADGRIRLNASAFTYEVEGYQAQVFLTVAEGSVITNAGDVRGTGAEIEVTTQITDNFELIAGAGWLDTKFDSEQIFFVAGDEYTLDGNALPSAPEFTYNFVARYYLGLENGSEVVFQGDYSWQDDHYLQIENDPYSEHEAYGIANAKVSWHSPGASWTVSAFANNLFDEEYFTYQNTLGSDWGYGVWGKPRMVGVRLSWQY